MPGGNAFVFEIGTDFIPVRATAHKDGRHGSCKLKRQSQGRSAKPGYSGQPVPCALIPFVQMRNFILRMAALIHPGGCFARQGNGCILFASMEAKQAQSVGKLFIIR